jgi:hypothetical protein
VTHTLVSAGLNLPVARSFAEAICNGAVLVAVHCQERRIRDAREILDTHNESDEVAGVRLR